MSIRMALVMALLGATMSAQDFGPDTCVSGFVWREAFPADHVCVTPADRAQAAEDNRLAPQRRAPGGGPYGPDTCRAGFVWREAGPQDHVCVPPDTRARAARDNQAPGRYVRSGRGTLSIGRETATAARAVRVAIPPMLQTPPPRSGSPVTRGFDENGQPYVEERLADGSVRREQASGVTVTRPDGTGQFFPMNQLRSNVQPPTPPELPSDPAQGRAWVTHHNDQLLNLIRALVNNDAAQMQTFGASEVKAAGGDLFRQVEYRTRVLEILARP